MGSFDFTEMIPKQGTLLWVVGLLVCIGHVSWHVEALNWFLGLATPHKFSKCVRAFDTLLLFGGLGLVGWLLLVG